MIDHAFDPDAETIRHLPPGLRRAVGVRIGSRRRAEILDYYRYCASEALPSPTVREIGEAVGLCSTSTVQNHLVSLVGSGKLVQHRAAGSRTILLPVGWWRDEPSDKPCEECGRR